MTTVSLHSEAVLVRAAADTDVDRIAEIYGHHVRHGLGSFEETVPDADEHRRRLAAARTHALPYLVAEFDGGVRGFAYAAPYRARSAYRYSVEDSVYVAPDWARRGIGTALLERLIEHCESLGLRQMVAIIGDSANTASIELHSRHGFRLVGTLTSVGYKFDRWVDSVIMIRPLGDGDRTLPEG